MVYFPEEIANFLFSWAYLGISAVALVIVGSTFLAAWLLAERIFSWFVLNKRYNYGFRMPVTRSEKPRGPPGD